MVAACVAYHHFSGRLLTSRRGGCAQTRGCQWEIECLRPQGLPYGVTQAVYPGFIRLISGEREGRTVGRATAPSPARNLFSTVPQLISSTLAMV